MTTETSALVRQLRDALQGFLNIVGDSRGVDGYNLNGAIAEWDGFPEVEAAESAITAADEWLAQQPKNLSPAPPLSYEKSPTVGNPWGDC